MEKPTASEGRTRHLNRLEDEQEEEENGEDERNTVPTGESEDDDIMDSEEGSQPAPNPAAGPSQGITRRTKKVKFPGLLHVERFEERTDQGRLDDAEAALELQRSTGRRKAHIHGVRGRPALRDMEHFRATWSNTSDTLHVVAEGLVPRMLEPMITGGGLAHQFQAHTGQQFGYQESIQRTVRGISELDHLTHPMGDVKRLWKALDFLNFLLIEVALLCCDEDVIQDTQYYELWVWFANCVYLMHSGKFDDVKMRELKEEMRKFTRDYIRVLGPWDCVIKFHLFQHFIKLIELHGPAFLWDAFMFERLLGIIKRDVTTTRHYVAQAGRNFVLRYFSEPFLKNAHFSEGVKNFLSTLNIASSDASLADLTIGPMTRCCGDEAVIPPNHNDRCALKVASLWRMTRAEYDQLEKQRLSRLRWYVIIFILVL